MGILDMLGGSNNKPTGGPQPSADANAQSGNPANPKPDANPADGNPKPTPYNPATPPANPQSGFNNADAGNQNPDDPLNIGAMLTAQRGEQDANNQPKNDPNVNFAQNLIQSVMSNEGNAPNAQDIPQVKPDIFANAMQTADFTNGIDFEALEEAMRNGDENSRDVLKSAFQSTALNAVFAMVPLINQMSTALHNSTLEQALSKVNHNNRSEQIISSFNQSYSYGDNPIVSDMVKSFATSLANKAPPTATPADLARALHELFSGMSGHIVSTNNAPQQMQGTTNDFSDLFG